mgnify:CR=1 FL=1
MLIDNVPYPSAIELTGFIALIFCFAVLLSGNYIFL